MAEPTYEVTLERNVPSRMRDGVTLFADIYRPAGDGPFPVVLMRLPSRHRVVVRRTTVLAERRRVEVLRVKD